MMNVPMSFDVRGFALPNPSHTMKFDGERFVSGLGGEIGHEHYLRYFFALQFCRGRKVLDVASGEGYGSALLASVAAGVHGVDLSKDAVAFATTNYGSTTLHFVEGDIRALPYQDASFEVVVSFETLEHIDEHELFLDEIKRVLQPGGLLVMSSPDRDVYLQGAAPNPFHRREINLPEFASLISGRFTNCVLGVERAMTGAVLLPHDPSAVSSVATFVLAENCRVEQQQGLAKATYVLAVASDDNLPEITWGLLTDPAYVPQIRSAYESDLRRLMYEADQFRARIDELELKNTELSAEVADLQARGVQQRQPEEQSVKEREGLLRARLDKLELKNTELSAEVADLQARSIQQRQLEEQSAKEREGLLREQRSKMLKEFLQMLS